MPFPDSSTYFSGVPWACLAETHQELQVIQAVITLSGNHPSVSMAESSHDWTPGHQTMKALEEAAKKLLPLQEV